LTFKNSLHEATTVHWHGVDVPNAMDGVPDVTQKRIQPGETFAYEFEARPAGTRWYHTHFNEHRQMDLGLAAPLIIEPSAPDVIRFDRDVTLVLDDWVTGAAQALAPTREGTAGAHGGTTGMMGGMMRGGMMRPMSQEPAYDTMTINGRAYPATEPLRMRKGERVRVRLINASNEHTHVVRLAGHRLHVTHTDGNPLQNPVEVDALPIAPAERYDVIVVADRPGAWLLHCTQPGHAAAGEQMLVLYEGSSTTKPPPPELSLEGLLVWHYGLGRGRPVVQSPTGVARTFDQTLSGGMMGRDDWTINGKVWPRTDPLSLARGDRGVVRFRNMSPEAHPMHLHGQSFRVLAISGARYVAPITKDTVDVDPHMGSAVVEFVAGNPGDWLFHCHKPMHMDGGMMALVKIA
jgi:FtsP/CotA-like multicopper oxidase with cupredoxin domain